MKYFCSFSEAIREGSTIRPQGFGSYFRDEKTCAYGAGTEAIFGLIPGGLAGYASEMFPYLSNASGPCPACHRSMAYASVSGMIYHLNDDHRWTRERIADWLQEYEDSIGYVTLTESDHVATSTSLLPEESGVLALH